MSKFDVMLIFVFVIITATIGMSFYQTVYNLQQFSAGFWTFITAVCGGEIVTFSLFRITKEKYERKAEKAEKEIVKNATNGKHVRVDKTTTDTVPAGINVPVNITVPTIPANNEIAPTSYLMKNPLITETEQAIESDVQKIASNTTELVKQVVNGYGFGVAQGGTDEQTNES